MKQIATLVIALFAAMQLGTIAAVRAETIIRVEVHSDPCREIAAAGKGKTTKVGSTTISMEPFYYASCEKVRTALVNAIESQAAALRKGLEGEVRGQANAFYGQFRAWLVERVYQALDPETRATIDREEHFKAWLAKPGTQELEDFVDHYIENNLQPFKKVIDRYKNDNSREIVSGLQALWKGAKSKLSDIIAAREEIAANPDTKYTDILRKYGLSAEWLDKATEYEGRFDLANNKYNIVKTAGLVRDAFTAEDYSGKIGGMFAIMEQLGNTMSDSGVPGISLLGTLIESYGQLAAQILKNANELKKAIHSREGFCVGMATHTNTEKRGEAFRRLVGDGIQACPRDVNHPLYKNIYYQFDPNNENQLYFWTGEGFVKGIETGGGTAGVKAAQALIRNAASIGLAEFADKETDLSTIADFYNTPYTAKHFLKYLPDHRPTTGLAGLVAEGEAVVDATTSRINVLRDHALLDASCGDTDFSNMIESQTGLRLAVFPLDDPSKLELLKISYAVGFVQLHRSKGGGRRTQSYQRYRKVWERLATLSMIRLEGSVVDKNNIRKPCEKCAGASLSMTVDQGQEMGGCKINKADEKGRFVARIITRTPNVRIQSEAVVGDIRSESDRPIDAWHLGLDGVKPPFKKHFSYSLLMPFEPEISADDAMGALRALHSEAMETQTSGMAACDTARVTARASKAQMTAMKSRVADVQSKGQTLLPALSRLTSALSQLDGLTSDAESEATKVADAKQKAEKAALLACEMARKVRKEKDENVQRQQYTQVQSATREAKAQATKAKTSFDLTAKLANTVERLAKDNEASAAEIGNFPKELGEVVRLIESATEKADSLNGEMATIQAAKDKLDKLGQRAVATHKTTIALLDSFSTDRRGELEVEADRLLAEIQSAGGDLDSCLTEITEAEKSLQEQSFEYANALDAVMQRLATSKLMQGDIPASDLFLAAAKQARSSADVAEVFEQVTASTAADAERCLALAKSTFTEGMKDDKSSAVKAAIAICRFKQARTLLLSMRDHPNYDTLHTLYRTAVTRESKTLADFERAQAMQKAGDTAGAKAALNAARSNTKCDTFRSKIDAALAALGAVSGDALAAEARSAIAACQFKTARNLISKLADTGHEAHAQIAALYKAAIAREQRTKALWGQAKAAERAGKREKALGLLQLARENTKCKRFIGRIQQALGTLRDALPVAPEAEVEPEPTDPDVADRWAGPWRGTIRLSNLQLNGRTTSVHGAIKMIADSDKMVRPNRRPNDGSVMGNAGAVAEGFSEMFGDIAAAIVAYVFGGLEVIEEGVEISFALEGQSGVYRMVFVGADKDIEKTSSKIPTFAMNEQGQLTLSKIIDEEGRARVSTQMALNEEGDRLTFVTVINAKNTPKPDDAIQIRTIRMEITGELSPGSIQAKAMAEAIELKVRLAVKRYLPKK